MPAEPAGLLELAVSNAARQGNLNGCNEFAEESGCLVPND
jgi:hypothetical protein